MGIPDAITLAENTTMSVEQAKDYVAILVQCQKEMPLDDENWDIMHAAILAEAQEGGLDAVRLALGLLIDLKLANRIGNFA